VIESNHKKNRRWIFNWQSATCRFNTNRPKITV